MVCAPSSRVTSTILRAPARAAISSAPAHAAIGKTPAHAAMFAAWQTVSYPSWHAPLFFFKEPAIKMTTDFDDSAKVRNDRATVQLEMLLLKVYLSYCARNVIDTRRPSPCQSFFPMPCAKCSWHPARIIHMSPSSKQKICERFRFLLLSFLPVGLKRKLHAHPNEKEKIS